MPSNTHQIWECHPEAEALILTILEECCQANPAIEELKVSLLKHTSTRLFDWLDHVFIEYSVSIEHSLEQCGFISQHATPTYRVFYHPGAQLPRVVLSDQKEAGKGIAITVDSIAEFLMVRGKTGWMEGTPLSPFRRCCTSTEDNVSLWIIERRGTELLEPTYPDAGYAEHYLEMMEKWQSRPRDLEDQQEAMHRTHILAQEMVGLLGEDLSASLVLECERKYWQARNTAGQWQKYRQDRLGMGWGNHDHHTFRSSRKHFPSLVRLFEMFGFHCRERFYAGEEAGWGAQVMENPRAKLVLFLDVDLASHELEQDFSHHPMPELSHLGTIGLWCALHGDSILQSGMHHLEAQFMFDELTRDLSHLHIRMMEPFSHFSYLKQAFTEGEVWPVNPKRVQVLLQTHKITEDQAQKFLNYGAVGSHLENLQRREGYKGFNQKNVSFIIKKTDPRELLLS
jgi:hypothetical protein